MTAGDRDYVRRLGDVLRRRDPAALREFLADHAAHLGDKQQADQIRGQTVDELELLLHRMIVARPDLANLHPDSERWLAAQDAAPPGTGAGTGRRKRRSGSRPSGGGPSHNGRGPLPPDSPPS